MKTNVRHHKRFVNGKWVDVIQHNRELDYSSHKPFFRMPKNNFQLPIETAVYVPSTQGKTKRISPEEHEERAVEVENFLAHKLGGFTKVTGDGGFKSSKGKTKGKIIREPYKKVTSFSTLEDYKKNQKKLKKFLGEKKKKWGQEQIGYEYEGDLNYF